jgi:putative transposase
MDCFASVAIEIVSLMDSRPGFATSLSMRRPANPYDNATCESFLKTLKREEIHASTYRDFEVLRGRMEEFIERYYNVCRLHSALDYRSPEDFEKESQRESQRTSTAAMMTFFEG